MPSTATSRLVPAGSCDCHFHVFGPAERYPIRSDPPYPLPAQGDWDDVRCEHDAAGFDRGLLVHPSIYGTDNRLLIDTLEANRGRLRGIALIDDRTTDAELEQLHAAGVRGARFHFVARVGMRPDLVSLRRNTTRIARLGWIAKVFAHVPELIAIEREIPRLDLGLPVLLDHMGFVDQTAGLDGPEHRFLLALLQQEHVWMQLSAGDLVGGQPAPPPWDAAVPFGAAYYRAAPERCVWGSDLPHAAYRFTPPPHLPVPADAALLALLRRYLPDDAAWERVLVHNPARLLGF